jgi:aspartate/methionine/tyrosine aminotransferase
VFAPTAYLRWAMRFYGRVEHDLASSGMTAVPLGDLGAIPPLDDVGAWERLRDRIAAYNGVSASEVLPALGTTHALWTAYASLLGPGDEVLVERPTYEPMYRIAEGLGAKVTRFERPIEERFALDPDRIARAISSRTRVVALTNLHNPGGVRASDEAIRAVAAIAERHGAHVLVDEVYAPFDAMCDPGGSWTGSARRLAPNIVVTSSLTKVYGLGAHRVGWMLAPSEVIARGEDAQISNLGHPPLSWAALGAVAFERLPVLAERARALLAGKRARVETWVAEQPHLRWSAPREGLFGFAVDDRGEDLTERIERAAHASGVLVAAGTFFGLPNGFRLSWSIDGRKLDEALARLGRVLSSS